MLFIGGQVADDKKKDIGRQTQEVLARIDDLLTQAGTDRSRLLSVQIWLKSMEDFDFMNRIYDAWVVPDQRPTRCCGEVRLADPELLIEMVVTAAL